MLLERVALEMTYHLTPLVNEYASVFGSGLNGAGTGACGTSGLPRQTLGHDGRNICLTHQLLVNTHKHTHTLRVVWFLSEQAFSTAPDVN